MMACIIDDGLRSGCRPIPAFLASARTYMPQSRPLVLFLLALTLHRSGGPHQLRQAKGAKNRTLAEPVAEPGERLDTLSRSKVLPKASGLSLRAASRRSRYAAASADPSGRISIRAEFTLRSLPYPLVSHDLSQIHTTHRWQFYDRQTGLAIGADPSPGAPGRMPSRSPIRSAALSPVPVSTTMVV